MNDQLPPGSQALLPSAALVTLPHTTSSAAKIQITSARSSPRAICVGIDDQRELVRRGKRPCRARPVVDDLDVKTLLAAEQQHLDRIFR